MRRALHLSWRQPGTKAPRAPRKRRRRVRRRRCRTEGTSTSATPGCRTSTSSSPPAAPARCGSATTSSAPPPPPAAAPLRVDATSGGLRPERPTPPAPPATATGCRAEGADNAPRHPLRLHLRVRAHRRLLHRQPPLGTEATGRTDDTTPAAAFISEGDAITRAAAPTAGRRAGSRRHLPPRRPQQRRRPLPRHPAEARRRHRHCVPAHRRRLRGGCPDPNHAAQRSRHAAACRPKRGGVPTAPGATPPVAAPTAPGGAAPTAPTAVPGAPNCRATSRPRKNAPRRCRRLSVRRRRSPHRCQRHRRRKPAGSKPLPAGTPPSGPQRLDDFRGQRRESQQGGRTIITEPGRTSFAIPAVRQYVRHSEVDRFATLRVTFRPGGRG